MSHILSAWRFNIEGRHWYPTLPISASSLYNIMDASFEVAISPISRKRPRALSLHGGDRFLYLERTNFVHHPFAINQVACRQKLYAKHSISESSFPAVSKRNAPGQNSCWLKHFAISLQLSSQNSRIKHFFSLLFLNFGTVFRTNIPSIFPIISQEFVNYFSTEILRQFS